MARRRSSAPELTLFPFLSVLAAVMGTLILIIAGMSQIALANPKQRVDVQAFDPQRKSPVYVECRDGELRIYGDDPMAREPVRVPMSAVHQPDGVWLGLMRHLARTEGHYLMLLVRPEGVRSFELARGDASRLGIELGYEPIFGSGALQFRERR